MPSPDAATLLTAARAGSRVVRYLIRPARPSSAHSGSAHSGSALAGPSLALRPGERDPWLPPPRGGLPNAVAQAQRAGSLVRRALGLLVLLVITVLAALLLGPLLLVLGIGTATGSDIAGWLLAFTLALTAVGTYRTVRRARRILTAEPSTPVRGTVTLEATPAGTSSASGTAQNDELALLGTLRHYERQLPASGRTALHATAIAIRDALRATADDQTLWRDTYDVQQAARRDLPDLLSTYQAAPRRAEADVELLVQLGHIERRMRAVSGVRAEEGVRALQANGRYLKDKYTASTDDLPRKD